MSRRLYVRAVALLFSLGAVSACASARATPKQVEVQTANGQLSLSLNGELPPHWPHDAPVPPGSHTAGSASLVGESHGLMAGVFRNRQSPEEVYSYYTTANSITVQSQSAVGSGNRFAGRVVVTRPVDANVTVVPYQHETLIVIVIPAGRGAPSIPTTLPLDDAGRR